MTGETEAKTTPWVERLEVEYAYGYLDEDSLKVLMSQLGWRGYPSAVLVDAKGNVVWNGHPARLDSARIRKHLRGATKRPVDLYAVTRKWPAGAAKVTAALAKQNLALARAEAQGARLDQNVFPTECDVIECQCAIEIRRHDRRPIDRHFRGVRLRWVTSGGGAWWRRSPWRWL